MASLSGFAKIIRQIGAGVEVGAKDTVRRTALAVDQTLVLSTPVDTGRARSNWVVSLSSPAPGTINPYVPGQGGSTGASNAAAAIKQAQAQISGYNGGSIFITNNLPYIKPLNDGSSAQAPAGFVQAAVQAGIRAVKGARLLSRRYRR